MAGRNPFTWWKRQKGERLVHNPTGNAALAHGGGFHIPSWERQAMLDPAGAQAYAYEGLALPVTSLMGGGYEHGNPTFTTRQYVAAKTVLPTSYGPVTGTMYTQPLYRPRPSGKV